jgi:hypothetical protein
VLHLINDAGQASHDPYKESVLRRGDGLPRLSFDNDPIFNEMKRSGAYRKTQSPFADF